MNEKKRRMTGVAAMLTALVLSSGHLFQLAGFLVGMAIVFMILSMLPDETINKMKRWKQNGT